MENENQPNEGYQLPGEEGNEIWNDLHEFFQDSEDDFYEL